METSPHEDIMALWTELENCPPVPQEEVIATKKGSREFWSAKFRKDTSPNEEHIALQIDFESCPPVSQAEIDAGEAAERQARSDWRVKFARKVGAVALCTVAVASGAAQGQSDYSSSRWAPSYAEIVAAPGSENVASDGTANLIFLGFGQYDGTNASREYFDASGGKELTAWIRYPSQSFTPSDLAPIVANYIRENQIKKLNLVGVSMGTVEAMETMRDVVLYDKHNPGLRGGDTLTNEQLMPEINYLVAYSSPGSMGDAIQGEVAHNVVSVAKTLGYEGDFAGKLTYSLVVRLSQTPIALVRPDSIPGIIVDSFEDANNPSPPEMAMSQLETLDDFNIQADPKRYQAIVNPDMKFVYISSPTDGIVNDSNSEKGYVDGFDKIGVTDVSSLMTDKDHANTAASAQAFGELLETEAVAERTIFAQTSIPFIAAVTP